MGFPFIACVVILASLAPVIKTAPCPTYQLCNCETVGFNKVMECRNTDLNFIPQILGDISEVIIQGNSISQILNSSFSTATSMTKLELNNNYISALSIGAFFAETSVLADLIISRNEMRILPNDVFLSLKTLNRLDLSYNQLISVSAENFRGLTQLEELDISENRLTTLPQDLFKYTPNLKTLRITGNTISFWPERLLSSLIQLTTLDISNNRIETVPNFTENINLKSLIMARNKIITIPLENFGSISTIQRVDFSNNWLHCDCEVQEFRQWTLDTPTLIFDSLQAGGRCRTPTELENDFLLTVAPEILFCPTTTTVMTTTQNLTEPPTTESSTSPPGSNPTGVPSSGSGGFVLSDTTLGIIIGCSIGGVVLIIIILIIVCTATSKKGRNRKDIRYILKTGSSSGSDTSRDRLPEVGEIFTVSNGKNEKEMEAHNGHTPMNNSFDRRTVMMKQQQNHSVSLDILPPKYEEFDYDDGTLPRTPNKMNGLLPYAFTKDNERRHDPRSKSFNYGMPKARYRDPRLDVLSFYNLSPGPKRHYRRAQPQQTSFGGRPILQDHRATPAYATYASTSSESGPNSPSFRAPFRPNITRPVPSGLSPGNKSNHDPHQMGPYSKDFPKRSPTDIPKTDSADSGVASPLSSLASQKPAVNQPALKHSSSNLAPSRLYPGSVPGGQRPVTPGGPIPSPRLPNSVASPRKPKTETYV